MPRRPDTPCSSCGMLLWSGTTSLPAGERVCWPCRRKRSGLPADQPMRESRPTPKPLALVECPICCRMFEQSRTTQRYCNVECRDRRPTSRARRPYEQALAFVRLAGHLTGQFLEGPMFPIPVKHRDGLYICPECENVMVAVPGSGIPTPPLFADGERWCYVCATKVTPSDLDYAAAC